MTKTVATLAAANSQAWNPYSGVCALAAMTSDRKASAANAAAAPPSPKVNDFEVGADAIARDPVAMEQPEPEGGRTIGSWKCSNFDQDQTARTICACRGPDAREFEP